MSGGKSLGAILGLNAFHGDAAACLLVDGKVRAAAEEERFRRVKHWAGFPSLAIAYCLEASGLTLSDIGHIALNSDPGAALFAKVRYALSKRPDVGLIWSRLKNAHARVGVEEHLLHGDFPGRFEGKIHRIEHHEAHLASAFYASCFDDAVAISVDGFGDFASAAWGRWRHHEHPIEGRIHFPHSLGVFYQAMTQFLGFPNYGDEFKLMGLAAYGHEEDERVNDLMTLGPNGEFRLNLKFFRHHRERVPYVWAGGQPSVGQLYSEELEAHLGPSRESSQPIDESHKALALTTQRHYERAFFHLLNERFDQHRISQLVLAGGCAMNSLANGAVTANTGFEHVFVQPAAGDAGGAYGAAALLQSRLGGDTRGLKMPHAYWGPEPSAQEIARAIADVAAELEAQGCSVTREINEQQLCETTAAAIANGAVVGWFQGRMEWGPRALGARSILADPRRENMRELLNKKIKLREPFRPFAPAVIEEALGEWFERPQPVPFMMQVLPIKSSKTQLIPAVTHVDGTGRVQTVSSSTNPRYYKLIQAFGRLTGVPMVLNTSFNENEPIVCTPQEALACFLRTEMDWLVLDDQLIVRR